jgi:hypothetical protein
MGKIFSDKNEVSLTFGFVMPVIFVGPNLAFLKAGSYPVLSYSIVYFHRNGQNANAS